MKEKLISIIVPIYNVEKYLNNCLDSIINQTYKNLEIILVDDGSPDNCPKICDDYAKKDKRIKVIHKENGGLSEARNYGIDNSTGEYLFFVDSDDYIHHECISILFTQMNKYNADLAVCNVLSIPNDFNGQKQLSDNTQVFEMNNIEACLKLKNSNTDTLGKVVWNKLYKKEAFNDIRFPIGMIHEDEAIIYQLVYPSNKVIYVKENLYYYRRSNNSIMRSKFNEKRFDILKALKMRIVYLKDKNELLYRNNLILYYKTIIYYTYLGNKFLDLDSKFNLDMKKEADQCYKQIPNKTISLYLLNKLSFFYPRLKYLWTKLAQYLKKFKKGYMK